MQTFIEVCVFEPIWMFRLSSHSSSIKPISNLPFTTVDEQKELSKPMIGSASWVGEFRVTDSEWFKAKFGVTPEILTHVWNMIVSNLNNNPPVDGYSRLEAVHVLYGLFFLRVYPTTQQCIATLGRTVGQNQFQKYAYFVIQQMSALSEEVVSENEAFINWCSDLMTYQCKSYLFTNFVGKLSQEWCMISPKDHSQWNWIFV